jgi:hypothetical protein
LGSLLSRISGYDYNFNDSTNTTINSNFQILKLDNANFSMPNTAGNFTYQLNFSGVQLFNETIAMTSIKNAAKAKIDKEYAELNASKAEIKTYNLVVQQILNEFLNITSVEADLNEVETQYKNANTDEEYSGVLTNISNIKIPEQISVAVNTALITFYPDRTIINLDVLKNIKEGNYNGTDEGYIDAIYSWNDNNLKTKVSFNEIVMNYNSGTNDTLKIFEFEFDKREMKDDAYFIIKDISNLKFENNISSTEALGYTYINLNDISDSIIFSTTEDVDFLNVPAFISPTLDNLKPVEVGNVPDASKENKSSKWVLFGVIVIILILIAIIAYVILQRWYRRKYENYLFKKRNNLYNIMTYIQNAKKKGMDREEMIKNLKKSNWTREQITYAIRKYEGKKIIGIIDRPFKKFIAEVERTSQMDNNTKV